MSWHFKRIYYGQRKSLNPQRCIELIKRSYLNEPLTIFDDWFNSISVEDLPPDWIKEIQQPFPDLLTCQRPPGRFALHLSGGVDSSILAFLFDHDEADYLVGTVEQASDQEFVLAQNFVKSAGLKGTLHRVHSSHLQALDVAREILPRLHEPLMDPAVVISYLVSQKAKELGHDLIISGDGADVAFGDPGFGMGGLRTITIWKMIGPANLLGLRTLLPYALPDLQLWARGHLTEDQRMNKNFLRQYAVSLNMPYLTVHARKVGWIGHAQWCAGEVYNTMRAEILSSPYIRLLEPAFGPMLQKKADMSLREDKETIFRIYSLIKWLEGNCDANEILPGGKEFQAAAVPISPACQYTVWPAAGIPGKIVACFRQRRLPGFIQWRIESIKDRISFFLYRWRLRVVTLCHNLLCRTKKNNKKLKCLYASPVGHSGKPFLAKIIERFGHEDFDYLIFSYDETRFDEPIFHGCQIIREKGLRWYFMKKYVTPEFCQKYDYIFLWADDIDVSGFDQQRFLDIVRRNNLQMAQPALTRDSYYDVDVTLQDTRFKIGRYTDYVEQMIPVFTREAWVRYWNVMEDSYNFWGWAYPRLAKSVCRFANMGIIDSLPVRHTRPTRSKMTTAPIEADMVFKKYKRHPQAKKICYGSLC